MIPERCPGLREQFVGEMEGLSWDEMERRYPGVREAYISDWFHTTPPGGESPEEMARRVGDCVDAVSYTHLDVYKRQTQDRSPPGWSATGVSGPGSGSNFKTA